MNDYVTEEKLNAALGNQTSLLRGKIRAAVDDISDIIANFATQVDERFNKQEERMDRLVESHDKLVNTIDGFLKRLDEVETEQTARDAQFDRLVEWAKEVSKKTGIAMPQL